MLSAKKTRAKKLNCSHIIYLLKLQKNSQSVLVAFNSIFYWFELIPLIPCPYQQPNTTRNFLKNLENIPKHKVIFYHILRNFNCFPGTIQLVNTDFLFSLRFMPCLIFEFCIKLWCIPLVKWRILFWNFSSNSVQHIPGECQFCCKERLKKSVTV